MRIGLLFILLFSILYSTTEPVTCMTRFFYLLKRTTSSRVSWNFLITRLPTW